jgi:hypothetical protein
MTPIPLVKFAGRTRIIAFAQNVQCVMMLAIVFVISTMDCVGQNFKNSILNAMNGIGSQVMMQWIMQMIGTTPISNKKPPAKTGGIVYSRGFRPCFLCAFLR